MREVSNLKPPFRCLDHGGNTVINKPLSFKVEVLRAQSPSRYATGVHLTLAKGAQSSFKEVCQRLRRDFNIEAARNGRSPLPSPALSNKASFVF